MDEIELLYRLALCAIPGIGPVYAKRLLHCFGTAEAVFKAQLADLAHAGGLGRVRAASIRGFDGFPLIKKELSFIQKHRITCLFFTDKGYPQRLLAFKETPPLLFYKGNADLNASRVIAVIGTRSPTPYGKQATERLIGELAALGPLIISGLALGIDGTAHKAALAHSLSTVGILGHGLDQIYPPEHRSLASQMVNQGGLLTSFGTTTEAAAYNFPLRNRIVAGMSDALVVVETKPDGGSILTVRNAITYKKKIFAIPGRLGDPKSSGCNLLIRQGVADLLQDASQLAEEMGWGPPEKSRMRQTALFSAPSEEGLLPNERTVLQVLKNKERSSIDELAIQSRLESSAIALALLKLELHGLVIPLPGKIYQLAS
jgi:DNA processing protein